jgi:hypothetical protein
VLIDLDADSWLRRSDIMLTTLKKARLVDADSCGVEYW